MISITILLVLSDILKNYLMFQQDTEDSGLSVKRESQANRTEILKL